MQHLSGTTPPHHSSSKTQGRILTFLFSIRLPQSLFMKPTRSPDIHSVSKSHGSCWKRNWVLYSSRETCRSGEKCKPGQGGSGHFMCFVENGFQHYPFVYLKTECCMGRAKEIIRLEWVATSIADNACILPHCPGLSKNVQAGSCSGTQHFLWTMRKVRHPSPGDALPRCCSNLSEPESTWRKKAADVY